MGWLYLMHFGDKNNFYIGATVMKPSRRLNRHIKTLRLGRGAAKLQAAFDEHGVEALQFKVLREVPDSKLLEREAELILGTKAPLNTNMGYSAIGRKVGAHPTSIRRRVEAGLDPMQPVRRATLKPYKAKTYLVGKSRYMTVPEIVAATGISNSTIHNRIKAGVQGPSLLAPSVRGRPRKA